MRPGGNRGYGGNFSVGGFMDGTVTGTDPVKVGPDRNCGRVGSDGRMVCLSCCQCGMF